MRKIFIISYTHNYCQRLHFSLSLLMAKKQMYWDDKQDELIKTIITSSGRTKNSAITKLYPALRKMGEAILNRYFMGSFNSFEEQDIITDGIANLLVKLHHFNSGKGKSFSYCQQVIKNSYINQLVQLSKNNIKWKEIMNEDPAILYPNDTMKYSYLDKKYDLSYEQDSMNVELVTNNERIMNKLYSIRKQLENHISKNSIEKSYYYKDKLMGKLPANSYPQKNKLKTINIMIKILEDEPTISYERFVIEINKVIKLDFTQLNHKLNNLGFNFSGIYAILTNYKDMYKGIKKGEDNWHGNIDWMMDDYPLSQLKTIQSKKYQKKKRENL